MPLKPLKPDGQPKRDDELTAGEQASRARELEDDQQAVLARAHRAAVDTAALANYQRSLEPGGKR